MTPPNVKRQLVCPSAACKHHCWEIEVGESERCPICGSLGDGICACGCGSSLREMRPDAVYRSEACAKRHQRSDRPDTDPTGHPLATARAEQEVSDLNSKLGQLVHEAIIDHLAKHGEVHADDLEDYYPPEHRDRCRKLLPGQLGSLRGRKYIQPTKEYRKSKVKARKGAKSWVYVFTLKGRGLARVGGVTGCGTAGQRNGGRRPSPHSDESAGVTTGVAIPKGSRGVSSHRLTGASSDPGEGSKGPGVKTGDAGSPRPTLFEVKDQPRSAFTDPEMGEAA